MAFVATRPLVARVGSVTRPAMLAIRPGRTLTVCNFKNTEAEVEKHEEHQVAEAPQQRAPALQRPPSALRVASVFDEMEQELNALTRSFFGTDLFSMQPFSSPSLRTELQALRLATDITEDDKGFTIKADVPGLSKEDIKLQLHNNILLISGERRQEVTKEQQGGGATWTERSYGSFARRFKLPQHVDVGGITAKCEDGVLTVTVPKQEQPQPEVQQIPVA